MDFCEQCGTKLNEGAKFCGKCGAKIAAAETGAVNPPAGGLTVVIKTEGDKDGRIQNALTQVLFDAGFVIGGNNAQYALNADVKLSDATPPGNPNKFVRYTVSANLTDAGLGNIVLPYSVTGREGHTTVALAEDRAVRAVEKNINDEFRKLLTACFSK